MTRALRCSTKVLGFGAIQLSHAGGGLNIEQLSERGYLSRPAAAGFELKGTAVQRAALGYLHGNCGGCHNTFGGLPMEPPLSFRTLVGQLDYAQTDAVTTTVGVASVSPNAALFGKPRIDPMAPANSTVLMRMSNRSAFPMPPVGSAEPDHDGGIADVSAWINSIPPAP